MDLLFQIDSMDIFTQVLGDIMDNLYDVDHIVCNKIIDHLSIKAAKEEIKNLILNTDLNSNKLSEQLSTKSYDNNKLIAFVSLLERRKSELLNLTIVHYNCAFGETVNSFDWKLKLVCGTSELRTFSYPLLQLALSTVTRNHKSVIRLHELNKDMLSQLIGTLEDIVGDNKVNGL